MRARTALLLLAGLVLWSSAAVAAPRDRYWQLGAGYYFGGLSGGLTEVDTARFDWLYLCLGNIAVDQSTVDLLNRLLAINPKLKIVIRVWPIGNLGDCKENSYQATFLHYLYVPGVKEKIFAEIGSQINLIVKGVSKPQNVVGATFLEELPYHFSGAPFASNEDSDKCSWDLERFRAEIEQERGKKLRWDDDTRQWWGRKWVQVNNEINAEIKRALPHGLVFYYQQTNHTSLDMVPAGTPLKTPMLMPVRWTDLIKPGVCDGFFAYPNSKLIMEGYLKLAREHDWLFFSQLAHPPYRLSSWEEHLALAKTKMPQNLGYFFYCEGDCAARQAWNVDPSLPKAPEWNMPWVSMARHVRRFQAQEKINPAILAAQPAVRLIWDLPLKSSAGAPFLYTRVIVEGARDPACYLDPAAAMARNVAVTLGLPKGFSLDPRHSVPATIRIGDLAPGERRLADWWVSTPSGFKGTPGGPFSVTATAAEGAPAVLKSAADVAPPCGEPHEIGVSGTEWLEVPFRLPKACQPRVKLEALEGNVRNPALSDGKATVRYEGTLEGGSYLLMDADKGTKLFVLPVLDDDGKAWADAQDPSGYKGHTDGYLVLNLPVRRAVKGDAPLKVTITGQGADGGQSLVVAHFLAKGEPRDVGLLANGFGADWGEASETIKTPADADTLQAVYLYRFKSVGKVWYGPVKVTRADIGPDGQDVSAAIRGSLPTLAPDRFSVFSYTDDEPPAVTPRVRVQLLLP